MANLERLRILADHLMNGELGHERFDFAVYNSGFEPKCGTEGCAIGECPIVFPGDWEFDNSGVPMLIRHDGTIHGPVGSAVKFFDITYVEGQHLFLANSQDTEQYGGKWLMNNATREEVAQNIYAFIELKSKG